MRIDNVEIYSDQTNSAVMRHPGRRFPGVLVQGDSLYILCKSAEKMCKEMEPDSPAFEEADDLRNTLRAYLNHYKTTLSEHAMELSFHEAPD
jgi:hypothetical protein